MNNSQKHMLLLVEDDLITANLESFILRKCGFDVHVVYNGRDAIDFAIADNRVDLILMDIELGGDIDGIEAADEILKRTDVPIVFLTSHSEKEIVEKTQGITSYGYVLKNTDENVIVASINMALKLFHANSIINDQKVELIKKNEEIMKTQRTLNQERKQLLSIFDSINSSIYVSDMDNYEILYANKNIRDEFHEEITGKICYKVLQRRDKPCDFCTNRILKKLGYKPYTWNYFNTVLNKEYQITDIMIKWPDGRDVRLEIARDISILRETEEALKSSERKNQVFLENFIGIAYQRDNETAIPGLFKGRIMDITGYTEKDFTTGIILWSDIVHHEDRDKYERFRNDLRSELGPLLTVNYRIIDADGNVRWVLDTARSRRDPGDKIFIYGALYDITEKKTAEQEKEDLQIQLIQSQKLESIGRLAGGLAHDFNNMLSVILGYSEIILMKLDKDDRFSHEIKEIMNAAEKSANLTKQLLAFAKKQTIEPKAININEFISSMINMLRRLIHEDIELIWKPKKHISNIWIDPGQVDQILVNLVVNSCDAIHGVGTITIETQNQFIDDEFCKTHLEASNGEYVMISVSDTGKGIDKEVLENIFEPFWTTKSIEKGTGLGLATVYGIVKQNNGFIIIETQINKGTAFKVYIPAIKGGIPLIHKEEEQKDLKGSETILVVEDKEDILGIINSILEKYGYNAIITSSPNEAVMISQKFKGDIHLLVTDVVMPEMNGHDLIKNVLKIRPNIKSLFMSGYTANVIARHGIVEEGMNFIQKPFSFKAFLEKIRYILDN